ncbi:hypothetical protein BGX38DRAFT_1109835, partial [Terfezia claveryi]
DILHNIHLGVLKNLMEWIQGFLGKHKRLAVFDDIWSTLPGYPGFTPPRKQYRQITMWSGTEMRGKDTSRLGPAAQADVKIAIRAVRALSDFCLIAQYRSHTAETIQYMTKYLQEFHKYHHVFGEFRASKADQNKAKLHLLTHYVEQNIQFGTLPQYSTEITESLHKPLKDAYKRSNRVDATIQILDIHTRDHAFKMMELNLLHGIRK